MQQKKPEGALKISVSNPGALRRSVQPLLLLLLSYGYQIELSSQESKEHERKDKEEVRKIENTSTLCRKASTEKYYSNT